ncbi:MAG: pyridoxamine 5'-phosphate oxidase family protein [Christensenellaceae bacterium]|nr:pyridoxamine 5'-phosphate oxidase family protein [Christensenellaceae bacterium]
MKKLLNDEEARRILRSGQYGVLSMLSPENIPYGVPLNYYYDDQENALFFHCALTGKKRDCIAAHNEVCFTVGTHAEIDAQRLTTYYESVIVTGTAELVTDEEEKKMRLAGLCRALTPSVSAEACKSLPRTAVARVNIESVTGKRSMPL